MRFWRLGLLPMMVGAAMSQTATNVTPAPTVKPADPAADVAEAYIGRALFLRCFCAENNLSFGEHGELAGAVKVVDWTLAAVNVIKVERRGPGAVEMEGVRVAIRYNPDNHEFQRHPQADEKMRITVADTGNPKQMEGALEAVFAEGIDLPLQRSMPEYWRHYFDPMMAWPADDLSEQTIYIPGPAFLQLAPNGATTVQGSKDGPAVTSTTLAHRADAEYTSAAQHDRVNGKVVLRVVVDTEGKPRRIRVERPLGYGLDERAVEALSKFRFGPALREGKPVPSVLLLEQDFVPVTVPR